MADGSPIKLGTAASATLVPDVGGGPRRHGSGLDQLIRRYTCAALPENVNLPSRYSSDREGRYPGMYLMDDDVQLAEGTTSTVSLTYLGSKDGTLPKVTRERGFSLQTATSRDEDLGVTLEVLYRAPHLSYHWVERSDSLRYSGYSGTDPKVLVRRIDGVVPIIYRLSKNLQQSVAYAAASDEARARIDSWLNANSAVITAVKKQMTDFFNRHFVPEDDTEFSATEIVPDRYWECSSTTRRILVSPT